MGSFVLITRERSGRGVEIFETFFGFDSFLDLEMFRGGRDFEALLAFFM